MSPLTPRVFTVFSFLLFTAVELLAQSAASSTALEQRIHPHLLTLKQNASPTTQVKLVISFVDTDRLPTLPRLDYSLPRSASKNQEILANIRSIIDSFRAMRHAGYAKKLPELTALGVEVQEEFWLINGLVVTAPLSTIDKLVGRDDVVFIEEAETSTPPPQATPTVADGRRVIDSDPLYGVSDQNASYWTIGMLDTGVRLDHTQFVPDNRITAFDCVNGTADYCRTGTNLNPNDDCNHGTSTAGILTANSSQGDAYRGVTKFAVRSYKVYLPGNPCGLSVDAAVRGFQAASADSVAVIVAEMQDTGGITGAVATAANNAFDGGNCAVIAANGNWGPGAGTVRSPAIAHRVIGVGAVDVTTLQTEAYQGRGPTPDGRIKPDVQAPTNTQTASNASTTALQVFTGTSGSTPYAGAATALLGHWVTGIGTDAGCYYARLINWGSNFTDAATNNTTGAGLLVLPPAPGYQQWPGKAYLSSTFPTNDITYPLPAGSHDFRAAIWWAEGYSGQPHSVIELHILDPSGIERASSVGTTTVFQKAHVPGPNAAGNWTLHLVCQSCGIGAWAYFDANAQQ